MAGTNNIEEKLRKIKALYDGATTEGERDAAEAARARLKQAKTSNESEIQRLGEELFARLVRHEDPIEVRITTDRFGQLLLRALCQRYQRYGATILRHPRQRQSTITVKAKPMLINRIRYEFEKEYKALQQNLADLTERFIREKIERGA